MSSLPEVLSETPDLQNGQSGTKYLYADGSIGFRPDDESQYIFVTTPNNSKITYMQRENGSFCKAKLEKPDGEIEFYFQDKDNRLAVIVGTDNSMTAFYNDEDYKKAAIYQGIDRNEYVKANYLYFGNNEYHELSRYDFRRYSSAIEYRYDYYISRNDIWETRVYGKSAEDENGTYTFNEDKYHNGRLVESKLIKSKLIKPSIDEFKWREFQRSEGTEYYDDENHRIKSTYKDGVHKEYYNNEENTLKGEVNKPHYIIQYDEKGNITLKATDAEFGKIFSYSIYSSGRIRSIRGEKKEIVYYDNDKHSLEEERDENGKITKKYSYDGDKLKEIEYKNNGRIIQKDVFNGQEQKICTFTYDKGGNKAKFFDVETQKITSTKEIIDGKEVETKYLYYPNGKTLSVEQTTDGKRMNFVHYDKDGNDDTRLYLAKKKVATKQVEKSERLKAKGVQVKNADGTIRNKMAVKKLNPVNKRLILEEIVSEK